MPRPWRRRLAAANRTFKRELSTIHEFNLPNRFVLTDDNQVRDTLGETVTSSLAEWAAKLIVRAANSADSLMRCTGSVSASHEENGYRIAVTRDGFSVSEINV